MKKNYEKEKKVNKFHNVPELIEHQNLINAILIDIKPDLYDHLFKKFTKEMVKIYIQKIKKKNKKENPKIEINIINLN